MEALGRIALVQALILLLCRWTHCQHHRSIEMPNAATHEHDQS